mgnify:CR=1 FL=1
MRLECATPDVVTRVSRTASAQRERLLRAKSGLNEIVDRDNPGEWVYWWIAEDAFELPDHTITALRSGGSALDGFFAAASRLYRHEPWIRRRVDKTLSPNYGLLNRAQEGALPAMPRPDVVLDSEWRPKFVELELTVCARLGTAAMAEYYGCDPDRSYVRAYAAYIKRRWPGEAVALVTAPHPIWPDIADEAFALAARLEREDVEAWVCL